MGSPEATPNDPTRDEMSNASEPLDPAARRAARTRPSPLGVNGAARAGLVFVTLLAAACGGGGGSGQPRVSVALDGDGRVSSQPAGLDCGATCEASFARGTSVVLEAAPGERQYFAGWSGACSGNAPRCTLTADLSVSVTASFRPATELALTFEGDGQGSVHAAPGDVTCTDDCSVFVPPGTAVTLTAQATGGGTFASYSGACVTTESECVLAVDEATSVAARFVAPGGLVWARRFGRETTDRGFGAAVDAQGAVLTTGYFDSPQADFGGGPLTNRGGDDVVVAKYRGGDGSHEWSTSFGGPSDERGLAVAVDSAGDVYVTGFFQETVAFGRFTVKSAGARDIFVAKLAGESGEVLWAKAFGTKQSDQGMGIAIARDGQALVTGFFLGDLQVGGAKLRGNGNRDVLVTKLAASDGHPLWARNFGGADDDQGLDVASDAAGEILLTGFFSKSAGFGSTELESHGAQDLFVTKLGGNDGHAIWASGFGSSDVDEGIAVAGTPDGHVALTGYFHGTDDLGPIRLTSAGDDDVLVAKLDGATGNPVWARGIGAAGSDQGLGLVVQSSGDVVVTGYFSGSVDFRGTALTSAGDKDIFVTRMAGADGATRWARSFGGTGEDLGLDVALDGRDFPFVTGWFFDATNIGGEPLDTPILRDLLVLRLGP